MLFPGCHYSSWTTFFSVCGSGLQQSNNRKYLKEIKEKLLQAGFLRSDTLLNRCQTSISWLKHRCLLSVLEQELRSWISGFGLWSKCSSVRQLTICRFSINGVSSPLTSSLPAGRISQKYWGEMKEHLQVVAEMVNGEWTASFYSFSFVVLI